MFESEETKMNDALSAELSQGGMIERNSEQCLEVGGGIAFLPAVAVGVAVCSLFSAAEKMGESMGRAYYRATH